MAISIISSMTAAWARALASTSFDVSALTMAQGDLLVLIVGSSVTQSDRNIYPDQALWTRVHDTLFRDDTNDINLSAWMMPVGSTPPTSINMFSTDPTTSATGSTNVAVLVLRGVDPTTPLDVTSTTADGINSAHVDPPAITPVTAGALILVSGVAGHIAAQAAAVFVLGSDITQVVTVQGTSGQTQQALLTVGQKADWTSGAFNPAAWSFQLSGSPVNATQSSWGSATMVFRPASSGGDLTPISGTAAGDLPLSGAATGTVADAPPTPISGTGAGQAPLSGAATGTVTHEADAQGTVPLSGSAQGTVTHEAEVQGTLPLFGGATGTTPVQGQSQGDLPLSGSGEASQAVLATGTAEGALPLSGDAQGHVIGRAVGQGELPVSGTAGGSAPVRAQGSGELPLAGDAQGSAPEPADGTAQGELPLDGSGGLGHVTVEGEAEGVLPLSGSGGEGNVADGTSSGTAAGQLPLGGGARGRAPILAVLAPGGLLPLSGGGQIVFPFPGQADPRGFPYRRVVGDWSLLGDQRDVPFPSSLKRDTPFPSSIKREAILGGSDSRTREFL